MSGALAAAWALTHRPGAVRWHRQGCLAVRISQRSMVLRPQRALHCTLRSIIMQLHGLCCRFCQIEFESLHVLARIALQCYGVTTSGSKYNARLAETTCKHRSDSAHLQRARRATMIKSRGTLRQVPISRTFTPRYKCARRAAFVPACAGCTAYLSYACRWLSLAHLCSSLPCGLACQRCREGRLTLVAACAQYCCPGSTCRSSKTCLLWWARVFGWRSCRRSRFTMQPGQPSTTSFRASRPFKASRSMLVGCTT